MGPIQNLHEILSWLRRRWRLMALTTLLGALAGVILAVNTDRVFTASAVIQVINPVIVAASEDGTGAASTDVTRRVQVIEQQLMSRDALLDLAQRHRLFEGMPLNPSEQVALMRRAFTITSIAAAQQGFARDGSLSALVVSADADDPQTAADIANELANQLVQRSVDARQSNAQQALDFFRAEETRLETSIATLEDDIAEFRSQNEAFLSDSVALRRAERARLIDGLRDLQADLSARQSELDTLDQSSTRTVVQRQVATLRDSVEQLSQQEVEMRSRIAEIQDILTRSPGYEQQVLAMNRRMEQLQAQLTAAADRRREAELSARIEDDQQAERFELLERALVPEYPVSRSRKTVAAMGIVAGLMLGLMLAYGLEWMQPVMRTSARMERDLQLRPVISIPFTMSVRERRRRVMIWGLGGLVLIGLALASALQLGLI
ncbi:GumC family protein [Pararhodobacter aggregans]|uniref:Polysaccharide chain length determinant N-terminal domain-containing protein n=1 Tax=Pararhodobacter aggregans TaxID=404875 RepID=A0A2T7ULG6_9RHOB|nr:Wzz/FepE/Etk N-terminal domain-containing protein [Pararhodobacter aggregans]PTW99783.1 uncharacterized protein involved in exopolysaccharide biosynthesis [Pararhodobacter aggregans]PVE45488.1 hypothetical protein DDE23_20925 [Pararhodobacter aggregans]